MSEDDSNFRAPVAQDLCSHKWAHDDGMMLGTS
jgi:hypothetical protein